MTEVLHHLMRELIEYSIILLELIGVLVLLAGALRATVNYIKGDPHTRVKLCRAMAMALEFKLGGEILRTVIVREFSGWLHHCFKSRFVLPDPLGNPYRGKRPGGRKAGRMQCGSAGQGKTGKSGSPLALHQRSDLRYNFLQS